MKPESKKEARPWAFNGINDSSVIKKNKFGHTTLGGINEENTNAEIELVISEDGSYAVQPKNSVFDNPTLLELAKKSGYLSDEHDEVEEEEDTEENYSLFQDIPETLEEFEKLSGQTPEKKNASKPTITVKFCRNCGNEFQKTDNFCCNCGQPRA